MTDDHYRTNRRAELSDPTFHKGGLCKLHPDCSEKRLLSAHTCLFIVVKIIDESHVLVVPVTSMATAKKAMEVEINSRIYYIRVMVFIPASVDSLIPVTKMWLADPKRVISDIYNERTRILEERQLKKLEKKNKPTQTKKKTKKKDYAEERAWKDISGRNQDERDAQNRLNAPKQNVPNYLSWNATHPFQGGRTNPK